MLQGLSISRDSFFIGQHDIKSHESERASSPADTPNTNPAESTTVDELDHHTDEIEPISVGTRLEDIAEPQVDASWVAIQTLRVPCVL